MSKPEKDYDNAWCIMKWEDGWYYYGWTGEPCGPYKTLEDADAALDDYSHDYDTRDE